MDLQVFYTKIFVKLISRKKCKKDDYFLNHFFYYYFSLDAESVLKDLQSVFITLLSDPAAPLKSRAAIASALGDCAFLGTYQIDIYKFSRKNGTRK